MTFRSPNDVSPLPGSFIARESVWWRAATAIVSLGILAFVLWLPPLRGWWLGWMIAALVATVPILMVSQWLKTLDRQNWILCITERNLLVKFRSFANAHFNADDKVVVSFSLDEIAWASARREKFSCPASEQGVTSQQTITYLELGLKRVDAAELDRQLTEERRRRPPPAMIETVQRDYPVQLANRSEGPVLQICWRGGSNWMTPSIKKTLATLAQYTAIRDTTKTTLDVSTGSGESIAGVSLDDQSRILAMAERGQILSAVKLARECYGFSLAEAKNFVEELRGQPTLDRSGE